jgi:hypothetical protein
MKNGLPPPPVLRRLRWWSLLWLWLLPLAGIAAEFQITRLQCPLEDDYYRLRAEIDYQFSPEALEALENGVRLTLELHIQIRQRDAWVWQEDFKATRLRYTLRYHALSSLYQLEELGAGQRQNFATLEAALKTLGTLEGLPLVKASQLAPATPYVARLKTSLDLDALPLPLRPLAYLSPSWNLSSGWRSCDIPN